MRKARPVVIVSLDALLHPAWRTRLACRVGGRNAEIAADQIRTISKRRLGPKLGTLPAGEALALCRLLTEMYGE